MLTFVFCLLAPIAVFYDTALTMFEFWNLHQYKHGYFILPLALVMVHQIRDELHPWQHSWLGIGMLVMAVVVWQLATLLVLQIGEQLALWLMIVACTWATMGWQNLQKLALPLALLLLALPFGDSTVPYLIDITTVLAKSALTLVGVQYYQEGNLLFLPGGTFEVAEACSGFKFLMTGMTIGFYVAFEYFRQLRHAVCFLLVVLIACILFNAIRAFIIIYVGSASQMKYLADDHVTFGWVLFAMAIAVIIYLGQRVGTRLASSS